MIMKVRFVFPVLQYCLSMPRIPGYEWTRTHAFFAVMGGFMVVDSTGQRVGTLLPRQLKRYLKNGRIKVDQREIKDKSSRDIFSKGIVLMQTSWFMIQCGARWRERLV